jgi:hypothetical protein
MAKGKSTARKSGRGDDRPKFHGTVVHMPPQGGAKIDDGDSVVVSILELSFGNLPDVTRLNELLFTIKLSTKDEKGNWFADSRTSGEFMHVPDGASLNVHDWVVFDGPVRRHLSLEIEITELESPRKDDKQKKELTETVSMLAESVGNLSIPMLDPVGAAVEILGAAYGAARAINGHDQVLKYFASLYTAGLANDDTPPLVEGVHVFEKQGRRRGKKPAATFATLKLRIRKAPAE